MRLFLNVSIVILLFFGGQALGALPESDKKHVSVPKSNYDGFESEPESDSDDFEFVDSTSDKGGSNSDTHLQNVPIFIVISNGALQNNAPQLINVMVNQQGLLDKLQLTTSLDHAAIPHHTSALAERYECLNELAYSKESILFCKPASSLFSSVGATFEIACTGKQTPTELITALMQYKALQRPVIILCDGDVYSSSYLMDQLKKITIPCIHSLIIFNRIASNNKLLSDDISEINFPAIEHRVYHFFTKSGTGNDGYKRKFFPSNGKMSGFSPFWCKIVNICCTQESESQIVKFECLEETINLNIPELIRLADENFKLNFDLNAVVSPLTTVKQCYASKPFLFMRRSLQANTDSTKKIQQTSGTRKWSSDALTEEEFRTVTKQLFHEEMSNNSIVKNRYEGTACKQQLKTTICPQHQEFQAQKAFESAAFFVPARTNNGVYLVLFIRSQNLETLLNEAFALVAPQRTTGNKPDYVKFLGTGTNHSYAVVKFFISNADWQLHQGKPIKIAFRGELLDEHVNLTVPAYILKNGHDSSAKHHDVSGTNFVVYADVQKCHQGYPLREAGSSVCRIAETIRRNELIDKKVKQDQYHANDMHLVVGDLVRSGSDIDAWFEIMSQLASMACETQLQNSTSLLAAAIGTHDFTHISKLDDKLLQFYPQMPTFLHLFVYETQQEQEIGVLEPNNNPQSAHAYFDVGPVRFIHLPYTTEEEGQDWVTTVKAMFNPLCFDFTGILDKFIAALVAAKEARERGEIDFIVVFGHAPLAVTPDYDHMHDGLFNFLLSEVEKPTGVSEKKCELAQKLLHAMIEYGVDVYFSGHNHQYDCCKISTIGNGKSGLTGSFTAVTVGLGNQLRPTKPTCKTPRKNITVNAISPRIQSATVSSEKFISLHHKNEPAYQDIFVNKWLPAYLKCKIKNHRLVGTLISTGKTKLHTAFDINSRRENCAAAACSNSSQTL